jgi:uncharacterized RDD family membrane protein YckC
MSQGFQGAGSPPRQGQAVSPGVAAAQPEVDAAQSMVDAAQSTAHAAQPKAKAVHPKVDAVPWEARSFQGQRAGIVTRTAANLLDALLVVGVLAAGYAAWCAVRFLVNPAQFTFPTVSFIVVLICAGIVLFVYFTTSWATTGRTFGDHQLGLRVVDPGGDQLRWPRAVIRAAFCVLLPIGLYWAVLSPTNRSVQDAVLRTSVIYDWTVRRRPPPRLTPSG